MITDLHLQNFRRHEDTELHFSSDAQLILLAGRNGAGKSTVLEAVTYALYGEGRHGKRNLAKLVRRGAELEGMQVDLTFVLGDVTYQVVRRYERGKSSATLYANGSSIYQTPGGVTGEITRVLGLDVVGFRLAVIAQQKDLNGLADMTASKRNDTMNRLLRLDAIKAAAGEARKTYNRERDIAAGMGSGPDVEELTADLDAQRAALDSARAALVDAREVVVQIDAELAASAAIDAAWQAAQIKVASAVATAAAAQSECDRISAELREVRMPPEMAPPAQSLEEIRQALTDVERDIVRGESAQRLAESAAATQRELDTVVARLDAIDGELAGDTPADLGTAAAALATELLTAESALAALDDRLTTLREEHTAVRTRIAGLTERDERAAALGDVCDACEQPISDEHKHTQAQARATELEQLRSEGQRLEATGAATRAERDAAAVEVADLRNRRDELARRQLTVESLLAEQTDLRRRRDAYTAQLARLDVVDVDLEEIYARKGDLKIAEELARQAEDNARTRKATAERMARLQENLDAAAGRLAAAEAAKTAAEPDADLVASYARRQDTLNRRAEEAELASACEGEVRVAEERVTAAERRISDAEGHAAATRRHKEAAAVAAKTAQLLADVAEKLATELRPALSGEITKLLTLLSEGRFTQVKIEDDYEILVLDDGKFEPLSEFSGGEADLIALAVRLALANVVAERHGAGGAGFLILDEVFGSQDDGRREAILGGLRNLRGIYGQIFLISHVGGLNEDADMVLEVSSTGEERIAEVVAA